MRKIFFHLVLVLTIAAAMEAGSFAALEYLRAKRYVYVVPRVTDGLTYATRLHIGDAFLGWPLKEGRDAPGGAHRDSAGARRVPSFPDPADPACVSLYGDSYVESFELDAEHAAANLLAGALGCRVANFGQAAYGTDQSYLRYQRNAADRAGIVVFGYMLENIQRNLNRNRDLLTGARDRNLKPRFILDSEGKLVLVPMPVLTEEEYDRTIGLRRPLLALEHESFQPGGDLLGPLPQFPYSLALARNLGNYAIRARIRGFPSRFAPLYDPDHPTRALQLAVAILREFHREAARRGQHGFVLLLPTREDMAYHQKTGTWIHQSLLERLDREGLRYLDFSPYLQAHRDRELTDYFTASGHYNEQGDALLAAMLANELKAQPRTIQ